MNGNPNEEVRQLIEEHGVERARLVALVRVARAVETLDKTSSYLSRVNIALTVVMALATLLQLAFLICKR
jgi:hypothetical protein